MSPRPCVTHHACDCQAAALEEARKEVVALKQERDGFHEEYRALCDAEVASLTAERDALKKHYDAAGPEHNLLALLDLWLEEKIEAQQRAERAEARAEALTKALTWIAAADKCQNEKAPGGACSPKDPECDRCIARAALNKTETSHAR